MIFAENKLFHTFDANFEVMNQKFHDKMTLFYLIAFLEL